MTRIFSFFITFFSVCAAAQENIYLSEGRIIYERKINVPALLKPSDPLADAIKKNTTTFKSDQFELVFNHNKTLYTPLNGADPGNFLWDLPAMSNEVETDLSSARFLTRRRIADQDFFINDSLLSIKWKITSETRNILGYDCIRANGLYNDTVYVVAFFSREILTKGGPETFSGLPGMILGLVLPHQHLSWFATRLIAGPIDVSKLSLRTNTPQVYSRATLADYLQSVFKLHSDYEGLFKLLMLM